MKILVVDDHVLIREALRGLFRELKPDAIVFEAADAARARDLGATELRLYHAGLASDTDLEAVRKGLSGL